MFAEISLLARVKIHPAHVDDCGPYPGRNEFLADGRKHARRTCRCRFSTIPSIISWFPPSACLPSLGHSLHYPPAGKSNYPWGTASKGYGRRFIAPSLLDTWRMRRRMASKQPIFGPALRKKTWTTSSTATRKTRRTWRPYGS